LDRCGPAPTILGRLRRVCRRRAVPISLRLYRRNRLDLDRAAYQPQRLFTEQDLAGLGGLLEPGGDVDSVAGGEPFLGPRDDLAGVDAGP
jgi:hypothetical protein